MSTAYQVTDARLAEIIASDARLAAFTPEAVHAYCVADWPEGDEHQTWLDTAPAQQIAVWALVGLRDAADATCGHCGNGLPCDCHIQLPD
jgi:hypothetical protein